jgi:hypothetical protein
MEFAGIFMLLVQIGFAVHAIRRGYSLFWVFLIVFVPLIGCLLYIIMVLLPEALQSRTAYQGARAIRKALDPGKELRELRQALEISDTVGNRAALAAAYLRQGMTDEAIRLYESSLTGMYRTDPELLSGLAAAYVQAQRYDRAKETLEALYAANPDYDNPDVRLLKARTLAELGDTDQALAAYAGLMQTASGAEVKCRYALLLKKVGRTAEAEALFREILKDATLGNRRSAELNREWVETAKRELG